ncbi:MAG: hypothetical protein SVY53_05245 [Chloroflexota bacterium]|nr:hypothetical protein [Chloroflexota bacterium]
MKYTKDHVGCWIDGANGETHAIYTLIQLVSWLENPDHVNIISELEECLEDDEYIDECINNAVDVLQENTDDGLSWIWYNGGDLCLVKDEDGCW